MKDWLVKYKNSYSDFDVISGMFRGIGDSNSPFILMMISCVINIIGDVLLVGFFDMAASGAAIATVFAIVITTVYIIVYERRRKTKSGKKYISNRKAGRIGDKALGSK